MTLLTDLTGLDAGIAPFVKILIENGVETCQSCEGGDGHCYDWPTIDFVGGPGAGWHALSICLNHGLPVMFLRQEWTIEGHGVTEYVWQLVFRHNAIWWTAHCNQSDVDVRKYMHTAAEQKP